MYKIRFTQDEKQGTQHTAQHARNYCKPKAAAKV